MPFFPLTVTDPASADQPAWLRTNLTLIDRGLQVSALRSDLRLVSAEPDAFEHPHFEAWLQTYADRLRHHGIRHLWWWISDHDEVGTSALSPATRMLTSFVSLGRRELLQHQAFGAPCLRSRFHTGLASVSHGVNYWESRDGSQSRRAGCRPRATFIRRFANVCAVPEAYRCHRASAPKTLLISMITFAAATSVTLWSGTTCPTSARSEMSTSRLAECAAEGQPSSIRQLRRRFTRRSVTTCMQRSRGRACTGIGFCSA